MSQCTALVVEDDCALREALCDTLKLAGYQVAAAADGIAALDMLATRRREIGVVVSDVQMQPMDGHALLKKIKAQYPDLPVLLMTAHGTIQKAVEAMHDGAADYLVKPFEAEVLVNMVERFAIHDDGDDGTAIARDPVSVELFALAGRVATSEATVLITGESGAGKEVLARYIHRQSTRSEGVFIAINCAAIPDNMLEATLFGYDKGAFTGAYAACPGKFEQAQGGTLLLDEISEMSLGLQAKLLRVLQEREVERLGSRKMIALDVRVLATSNRNLKSEVAAGRFREDLFYRLSVFPLHMPPLRDRPGDIVALAERSIEKVCRHAGQPVPVLSDLAKVALLGHPWPGNVRELDNVMQRALIVRNGQSIEAQNLHFESTARATTMPQVESLVEVTLPDKLDEDLKTHEQRLILEALRAVNGNRQVAARKLGISPRTLRYKLSRMRDSGVPVPKRYGREFA